MHHSSAGWDVKGRTKDLKILQDLLQVCVCRQESTELTLGAVPTVNILESATAGFVLLRSGCPVAVAPVMYMNTQVSVSISQASPPIGRLVATGQGLRR